MTRTPTTVGQPVEHKRSRKTKVKQRGENSCIFIWRFQVFRLNLRCKVDKMPENAYYVDNLK